VRALRDAMRGITSSSPHKTLFTRNRRTA
jgi:hypothetical protein